MTREQLVTVTAIMKHIEIVDILGPSFMDGDCIALKCVSQNDEVTYIIDVELDGCPLFFDDDGNHVGVVSASGLPGLIWQDWEERR